MATKTSAAKGWFDRSLARAMCACATFATFICDPALLGRLSLASLFPDKASSVFHSLILSRTISQISRLHHRFFSVSSFFSLGWFYIVSSFLLLLFPGLGVF